MAFEHKENTATVFENDKKSAEINPTLLVKVKWVMKSWSLQCGGAQQKAVGMSIST